MRAKVDTTVIADNVAVVIILDYQQPYTTVSDLGNPDPSNCGTMMAMSSVLGLEGLGLVGASAWMLIQHSRNSSQQHPPKDFRRDPNASTAKV